MMLVFDIFFVVLWCIVELFGIVFHSGESSNILSKSHERIFLLTILVIEITLIIFFHKIHLIIIIFIIIFLLRVRFFTLRILIFLVMFSSRYDGGFEERRMISRHHLNHGIDFSFWHLFCIDDKLIILFELWWWFGELIILWGFDIRIEKVTEKNLIWI